MILLEAIFNLQQRKFQALNYTSVGDLIFPKVAEMQSLLTEGSSADVFIINLFWPPPPPTSLVFLK